MGLSIKDAETIALVRELADRTGTSQTAAIADAVRHRLDHLAAADQDSIEVRRERANGILQEIWDSRDLETERARMQANLDDLYDELGLPK
ncbi:MAG: type II toxin-antitoxin system VapB family antitoxin [Bifidobacteriaceae bacterium]|nr:type II toxin-antitoxin system VapB family antitoxin [Bifidobacteriaceae bacterium]